MIGLLFRAAARGLVAALGRDIVPAPPHVVPEVREVEDPDLQELSAQEIKEIELAEALWPQKELAAHLQGRYGDGEAPPTMDKAFAGQLKHAEARAVRPLPHLSPTERRAEIRRMDKLPDKPTIRQAHETPHEERLAEIIQKTSELSK